MENIVDKIKNLTPGQRSQLLAKLGKGNPGKTASPAKTVWSNVDNYAYRFRSERAFDFDLAEVSVDPPEPGYVQVEARACSLNFRDVMIASSLYAAAPGVPANMGSDYSGVVTRVGAGVEGFKEGDEVIGLIIGTHEQGGIRENCHFVKRGNIHANCLALKPKGLSHQEACCIPTVYLTSYVGLIHMARLTDADTVLLQTATGGVGLSAIQIAKWKGARIFATAGSASKRDLLDKMDIRHAMDSRSLAFETEIKELTLGEGVDVVLNTLSGEALEAGLRLLKPFGRFVHIDNKDVAANRPLPMGLLQKSISFSYLDISLLFIDVELMQARLREIAALFDAGQFKPINFKTFSIGDVKKALNELSHSTHMGKLVLTYD